MLTHLDIMALARNYYQKWFPLAAYEKYARLPKNRNYPQWPWEGKDFARVIALLEFEDFSKKYPLIFSPDRLLTINSSADPEIKFIDPKFKFDLQYDDDRENYDLHDLKFSHINFDFVIMNQTIEHLYDPISCLKNINKIMRTGGHIYVNVPAVNIPHDTPFHYSTGVTPIGLLAMLCEAGFEIIEAGQWGNKEYILQMFDMNFWPDINALKNPHINLHDYPVITWSLARKK